MEKKPEISNIALELKEVCKTFHSETGAEVPALHGVNMVIQEGEFITLVGPTGCGKTTLLNIVAGLETADSGMVRLAGGLSTGKSVSCVFQHYTLFPWRSVLRNVTFGLEMRGVGRQERNETGRGLLAKLGLARFENAYPHELSGGMRQRAAIAQALAPRPSLLLMDEPFGALDDSTRKELQHMLVDLWRESAITVLFVTHNIDEAILMGGRVLVFCGRPGRILQEFEVNLPRPRDGLSRDYTDIFVDIRQTLHDRGGVAMM